MDEKIMVYGLVVAAIVLLAWTVAGALKPVPVAAAAGSIGTDDACKMPDGYPGGLDAWRTHLGHHEETRVKCLGVK